MRLLIRLAVIAAILWCGWWALASWGAQRGLSDAFTARQGDGWQAEVSQSGFPLRIRSELRNVELRDPESALTLRVPALALSAPTLWPGYLTLDLPSASVTIARGPATVRFEAQATSGQLRVRPGMALALEGMQVASDGWRVGLGGTQLARGQSLDVQLMQDETDARLYDLTLDAAALEPGTDLRDALSLDADWPAVFDAFDLSARLLFDKPLDRHAGQGVPPRLREVEVQRIDITWGDISLTAQGALRIDDAGVPDGRVEVSLRNWRLAMELARNSGAVPAAMLAQSELLFAALANQAGSPENLDLMLTFEAGRLSSNGVFLAENLRF